MARTPASPASTPRLVRALRLAWASPNTLLGLVLGSIWWLGGARPRQVDGVLELALKASAQPTRLSPWRLPFGAITLGHVVLAVDQASLDQWRVHERVHVAQYERWGPLFLPAYLGSSLWQWLCGRDAYWDNPFEVEARRADGR
ncbi:signal peptide prediction [Hydrogenophaga sp.]|uniref:signal peptide prediction n=1 Tax=Hydrogenophaga sp. TaxID=1904254 RepID=UPI0025BCFE81|nr:signal peptide prediction [Hydrogenophaga sp.]